jgi:transposase
MTLTFEAWCTSNYWKQRAIEAGHDAHLISAKLVASIRQNQKKDKNDALAIAQASQLADIQFVKGKSVEQQQLQSIMRMRELAIKQKTAPSNQIKALLLEFNIRVSLKQGGLKGVIESLLEDAENGFSSEFRRALNAAYELHREILDSIRIYDRCLETTLESMTTVNVCLNLKVSAL